MHCSLLNCFVRVNLFFISFFPSFALSWFEKKNELKKWVRVSKKNTLNANGNHRIEKKFTNNTKQQPYEERNILWRKKPFVTNNVWLCLSAFCVLFSVFSTFCFLCSLLMWVYIGVHSIKCTCSPHIQMQAAHIECTTEMLKSTTTDHYRRETIKEPNEIYKIFTYYMYI